MKCDMKKFVEGIFSSPRRLAIPIMTSPGFELEHLRPSDVFRSGELEFRCIRRLAEETPADALVTFMDLSVEAEAFGSEIRWSEYENPTVSGSIASTLDEIEKLKIPEAGSGRTGITSCAELIDGAGVLASATYTTLIDAPKCFKNASVIMVWYRSRIVVPQNWLGRVIVSTVPA